MTGEQSVSKSSDLVVVGSSAGGVGALSTLVSTLNKNFPAPVVLAQHLDPQRPSNLGSILERRSNLPIVVVGVGAPSTLGSTLKKKYTAPEVLAQHLDPQRPSNLGSILERRSNLPIVVVGEQSPTLLESGKIYVVPSNRHVKIRDGHVHLEGDHVDRPKPSVDMLLSSAAESYGEHLIAVIL